MTGALAEALKAVAHGRDLSAVEAEAAVGEVLDGGAPEAVVAGLLTALRVKGETADELAGTVRAVLARAATGGLDVPSAGVVDTCGTGGDGARTVNVSTASAVVVAACGVPVAKHGNRAASGNSGSAEVLTELGVDVEADPTTVSRWFAELRLTFFFAPKYHPGLRGLAPVRKALPFRTVFNLVGPLANPCRPAFQLIGVPGGREARLVAGALARLGVGRAAVVHGSDGLDEVTLNGPTAVHVVERGSVVEREWTPADFGLGPAPIDALRVSGAAESAGMIRRLLAGDRGPVREMVLANAAAALWVAGEPTLAGGVARAAEAIDSGRVARLLARWVGLSRLSPANGP